MLLLHLYFCFVSQDRFHERRSSYLWQGTVNNTLGLYSGNFTFTFCVYVYANIIFFLVLQIQKYLINIEITQLYYLLEFE